MQNAYNSEQKKLKYQLASDLHIEYLENPKASDFIKKNADILVLAGDIGSLYKINQLETFLKELNEFEKILYIPGNHEFYMIRDVKPKPFNHLLKDLFDLEKRIPNLIVMNCNSVIIDDIEFLGCTLWSNLAQNFFPKYRVRIYGFTNIVYQQQYDKNLQWLKKTLNTSTVKDRVVITHYPPLHLTDRDKFPYLYSNNLEHLIKLSNMLVWNFGHIHVNHMFTKNDVLLVTNQTGRIKDNVSDYVRDFIVTV
jgi:predicted phosphodiesterase